jgi:hypothetical protein
MAGWLFFILYLPFYFAKGLIFKRKAVQAIMTLTVLTLGYILWTVVLSFSGWAETVFKIFLLAETVFYLFRLAGVVMPTLSLFSRFSLDQEEITIQYSLFKPFFLLIADLVLLIKKLPVLHLKDVIEIDVKVNNRQMVLIKL